MAEEDTYDASARRMFVDAVGSDRGVRTAPPSDMLVQIVYG